LDAFKRRPLLWQPHREITHGRRYRAAARAYLIRDGTIFDSSGWSPLEAELPMCEKCVDLDNKTEHYRRISASISDQLTVDRIDALVEKLEAEKAALHPPESAGPHS
jgi:hypothetical protein